ncbi:MAG: AraD1 family protein [Bryobacteraceae bacterium]|nr:AraD1 family protein [Bryobacteraceae bacterium]
MRLIQLARHGERRLGAVEGGRVRLLADCASVVSLAEAAHAAGASLSRLAQRLLSNELLNYDEIYDGLSAWRILPAADHPSEPARCIVSGTGLTHSSSAKSRNAMHASAEELSDSMRVYRWGLEAGRPAEGEIGASPEWFYKGTGTNLRGHLDPLDIPAFAEDGGEEAEIAGVYWIDPSGVPRRLGMAQGNEFSDHRFEQRNYLYLAASKLRSCAIGPELVLDPQFSTVAGRVSIERAGAVLWCREIRSGEEAMCHSLANLEHHHFKFPQHRRPGDVHVHFYGADALSFADQVHLQDGDTMSVAFEGFGRPLRNRVRATSDAVQLVRAVPM